MTIKKIKILLNVSSSHFIIFIKDQSSLKLTRIRTEGNDGGEGVSGSEAGVEVLAVCAHESAALDARPLHLSPRSVAHEALQLAALRRHLPAVACHIHVLVFLPSE
jgi:hypothetical protein